MQFLNLNAWNNSRRINMPLKLITQTNISEVLILKLLRSWNCLWPTNWRQLEALSTFTKSGNIIVVVWLPKRFILMEINLICNSTDTKIAQCNYFKDGPCIRIEFANIGTLTHCFHPRDQYPVAQSTNGNLETWIQ